MKKIIAAAICLVLVFSLVACSRQADEMKYDLIPMIMVDGKLYLDTGHNNADIRKCETFDGKITSEVAGSEKPAANDQSNFGTGFGYQYGAADGTIEVNMDGKWRIFATEEVRQKIQFPESEPGAAQEIQPAGITAEEAFDITVSYANWTEESDIFFRALNTSKMSINSVLHLPIYKFDTSEELEHFKLTFGEMLAMDSTYNEVPSFNDATSGYDEAFFDENALMLVYVSASSGTYRFGVNSVFCNGSSFCIHIEQLNDPEVVTDDMAGWFITVAVPDSMIANCSEFDADLNNIEN